MDDSSMAAESVLARVFRGVPFGFGARLWDGREVRLGGAVANFTLVFRSPAVFRRLMLRPNTLHFAEAFVDGELDVEGDFFEAIGLANRVEALRLGLRDRLAIAAALFRIR